MYYQASDGSIRLLGDNELTHYNHNHDALGRFARSGGMLSGSKRSIRKANRKELQVLDSFDENVYSGNDPYPHKKSVKALNDYKNEKMKNRQSVVDAIRSDFKNDKEYKSLKRKNEEAHRKFVKEFDKLESANKSYDEEKYNKAYKNWRETDNAVYAKQQQIVDKHAHEFASAYLKDLGIKETQKGKDYVLKNMQRNYHVEVDSEHPNAGNVPWDTYESVSNKMLAIDGNNYDPSYQTRQQRKEVYKRRKQYMK